MIRGYEGHRIKTFTGDTYYKVDKFDNWDTWTGTWRVDDADSLEDAVRMIERNDYRAHRLVG